MRKVESRIVQRSNLICPPSSPFRRGGGQNSKSPILGCVRPCPVQFPTFHRSYRYTVIKPYSPGYRKQQSAEYRHSGTSIKYRKLDFYTVLNGMPLYNRRTPYPWGWDVICQSVVVYGETISPNYPEYSQIPFIWCGNYSDFPLSHNAIKWY